MEGGDPAHDGAVILKIPVPVEFHKVVKKLSDIVRRGGTACLSGDEDRVPGTFCSCGTTWERLFPLSILSFRKSGLLLHLRHTAGKKAILLPVQLEDLTDDLFLILPLHHHIHETML